LERGEGEPTVLQETIDGHRKGTPPGLTPNYLNSFSAPARRHVRQEGVFVLGFPRSGTTLMQSVLARGDERVRTAPETHFFNVMRRRNLSAETVFNPSSLDRFLGELGDKLTLGEYAETRLRRAQQETPLREVFERTHEELFGIYFWRQMQDRQQRGEMLDVFPYRRQPTLSSGP
ncbi:MAG: sulfotransferase, partial [Acidobacteriota bacterium]